MLAGLPKLLPNLILTRITKVHYPSKICLNRMYKLGKITLSEYQKNYELKLVLNKGKKRQSTQIECAR